MRESNDPYADDPSARTGALRYVVAELRRASPRLDPETVRVAVMTALDLAIGGNGTQGSLLIWTKLQAPIGEVSALVEALNVPGALDGVFSDVPKSETVPDEPESGLIERLAQALPGLAAQGEGVTLIDFTPHHQVLAAIITDPAFIPVIRRAVLNREPTAG